MFQLKGMSKCTEQRMKQTKSKAHYQQVSETQGQKIDSTNSQEGKMFILSIKYLKTLELLLATVEAKSSVVTHSENSEEKQLQTENSTASVCKTELSFPSNPFQETI